MVLTKQQKVLGVILALGVGAVAVDRLMLSGATAPSAANAAPVPSLPSAEVPAADNSSAGPAGPTTVMSQQEQSVLAGHAELAARLNGLADAQALDVSQMRDALVPSGSLAPKAKAQAPAPKTQKKRVLFNEHFRLEAVMADGRGGGVAVVAEPDGDTMTLRVGDDLHGFMLTELWAAEAIFMRDGRTTALKLTDPK